MTLRKSRKRFASEIVMADFVAMQSTQRGRSRIRIAITADVVGTAGMVVRCAVSYQRTLRELLAAMRLRTRVSGLDGDHALPRLLPRFGGKEGFRLAACVGAQPVEILRRAAAF